MRVQRPRKLFGLFGVLLLLLACGAGAETRQIAAFDEPIEGFVVHSKDYDYIYALTPGKFHVSTDGGASWAVREPPFLLTGDRLLIPDRRDKQSLFSPGAAARPRSSRPASSSTRPDGGTTWDSARRPPAGPPDRQLHPALAGDRHVLPRRRQRQDLPLHRWRGRPGRRSTSRRSRTSASARSRRSRPDPKRLVVVAIPVERPVSVRQRLRLGRPGLFLGRRPRRSLTPPATRRSPRSAACRYSPRDAKTLWGVEAVPGDPLERRRARPGRRSRPTTTPRTGGTRERRSSTRTTPKTRLPVRGQDLARDERRGEVGGRA